MSHSGVFSICNFSMSADSIAGKATHLDCAVQSNLVFFPVCRNCYFDNLFLAAEIVFSISCSAAIFVRVSFFVFVGNLSIKVILCCKFFCRICQAFNFDCELFARCKYRIIPHILSCRIKVFYFCFLCSYNLVRSNAVFFQSDDMTTCLESAYCNSSVFCNFYSVLSEFSERKCFFSYSASVNCYFHTLFRFE